METLPLEMVLKISGYLTPQELARCCGVCRDWHEMFNADCHWKPHCDPEVAEHLRNTSSVVEPVFVTPEATDNTLLTPIGHWRLAFTRVEHLWKNLKQDNHKREPLTLLNEVQSDFLTNTLLVKWFGGRIEIWDVSVTPMVFVARTDPSVYLGYSLYHCVVGSSMLLVEQKGQIKVFHVDALNKRVELRRNIPLNELNNNSNDNRVVKDNIYLRLNPRGLSLEIIDLETGELKRIEPIPTVRNGKEFDYSLKSFPTSDIIVVEMTSTGAYRHGYGYKRYHFYSLRQLTFLQGPDVTYSYNFAFHEHYLVLLESHTVKIYNYHTSELIYNCHTSDRRYVDFDTSREYPHVFNNSFIFRSINDKGECWLEMFSVTERQMTAMLIETKSFARELSAIHNKILYEHAGGYVCQSWKASGRTLKQCKFNFRHGIRFNQALTRGLFEDQTRVYIYHYW